MTNKKLLAWTPPKTSQFFLITFLVRIKLLSIRGWKWFYHRTIGSKVTNHSWCTSAGADKKKVICRSQKWQQVAHKIIAETFLGDSYGTLRLCRRLKHQWTSVEFLQRKHQNFSHLSHNIGWKNSALVQDNARPHVSRLVSDF